MLRFLHQWQALIGVGARRLERTPAADCEWIGGMGEARALDATRISRRAGAAISLRATSAW